MAESAGDPRAARTEDSAVMSPTKPGYAYVPGFRTGVWWKALLALGFYGTLTFGMLRGLGVGKQTPYIDMPGTLARMGILVSAILLAYAWSLRYHLRLLVVLRRWPTEADLERGVQYRTASSALKGTERAHSQTVQAREQAITAARSALEQVERKRQTAIDVTEQELAHLRNPGCGRRVDGYLTVTLYEHCIATPAGTSPLIGARATVATGQRVGVSELFLQVDTPALSSVIRCNPSEGFRVREFAVLINNTAIRAAQWAQARPGAIRAAEQRLLALRNNVSDIEAARQALTRVESNEQLLRPVQETEKRLIEARAAAETAEHQLQSGANDCPPSDASHSAVADHVGTVSSVHDVDTEQPAPRDSASRRLPRPLVWALGAIFAVLAFAISLLAYPVISLGLLVVALALATDLGGMRSRIRRTGVWRSVPWLRGTRPVVAALVLLLWAGTTGTLGFSLYKSDHNYRAHIAAVTATAVVHARRTATAIAVAQQTRVTVHALAAKRIAIRGTATAVSIARSHATAQAIARKTQVVAQRTAAVRATTTARAHATAQARSQQTQVAVRRAAAPGETATAVARATDQAVAQANARATAQAQQAASAQATTSAANVLDVSGSGIQNTQKFTTNGDEWQIRWSYDCSNFGDKGNFIVSVVDSSGVPNPVVNELNSGGSGTDYEHQGGTYYVEVNSECSWHVQVVSP